MNVTINILVLAVLCFGCFTSGFCIAVLTKINMKARMKNERSNGRKCQNI